MRITDLELNHRYDFRDRFERESRDIIQPDLTHCRGLFETKKLAAITDMHYLLVAPPNVAGPVATAANLHLSATLTNFRIQENVNDFQTEEALKGGPKMGKLGGPVNEAVSGCPEVIDGYFSLPQGPGLGVTLNDEVICAHPMQLGFFNLDQSEWQKRQAPPSELAGNGCISTSFW